MTQQDDITQRVLTDDEINTAIDWPAANTTMRAENDRAMAREVEAAVLRKLSKLRAPVADERAAFEAYARRNGYPLNGHGGFYGNTRTRNQWMGWKARAALASAPADPEAAEVDFLVRVLENLDTWRAEEWSELLERRPAILAMLRPMVMASAPVAGEAQSEVAKLAEELGDLASDMAYEANQEMDQEKATRAAIIERGERAIRRFADAAPQASAEDVRNAALEVVREALDAATVHPCDEHDDESRAATLYGPVRKLYDALKQPQADKDGGQQLRWRVTDDMRYAVRFAPSSAHWSERLKEFFGPDAREGIDALEKQLREARAMLDRLRAAFDHPVFAFLLGEGQLHGVDFGERAPGAVGKWWWRKDLRAALSAPQAEQGERDA
ncbi:hypothetical protein F1536_23030 [Achromobacter xylosoxidans]|uniref:hypothetical protein n=1 Tax=Alcaligenes xylosoxydans xylosoxydans TaxID=85698 RepID=UPI001232558E|nr:hypothetical protein [Achromobacter xylosoxidans]KAA5921321.1 hypothetical protein F1536_23030 [Achromobacter xylosoxidans]